MSTLVRTLGYTAGIQRLVWPAGTDVPVTAYLWGGGGGRGGNDDTGDGGRGQGGGFTEVDFTVNVGDVIEVAVGGPGVRGRNTTSGKGGGAAGASFVSSNIFDTRSATAINGPVIASTNSAYVGFLNTHGVWINPVTARDFDRSYIVTFPYSGAYTITASADNSAEIYVDDVLIGTVSTFTSAESFTTVVDSGPRTVRIVAVNTGGPGSVGVTISGGLSFSGGRGGNAGNRGYAGAGGGGGGATVILLNGAVMGAAGGGGGGGGAGRFSPSDGQNAPGSAGQAGQGINNGQNGQNKSRRANGGGGGGGGGGIFGGNGGLAPDGDRGAFAGTGGFTSAPAVDPIGPNAGGRDNPFYPGSAGQEGSAGAAVLAFEQPSLYVHNGSVFVPVKTTWINLDNSWVPVTATYVRREGVDNNVWEPLSGSFAPVFTVILENFGIASRPIEDAAAATSDPAPAPDFNTFEGGGQAPGPGDSISGVGGGTPGDASGDGQASA